ncbi:MAG: DUF2786 domain-containing protein [Acidimicrobiales bacterium]
MGRRSRKRVRDGLQPPKQRHVHVNGARNGVPGTVGGADLVRLVERQFRSALDRFDRGEETQAEQGLVQLAGWWTDGVGRRANETPGLVPALVCSYLCGEIEQVWGRGWQPADVPRVVERHLGPKHSRLVVQAIAEEAETYRTRRQTLPSWLAQLAEIDAVVHWSPAVDHLTDLGKEYGLDRLGVLRTAFELLVTLHHLPDIPQLCPPPSEWGRSAALDAALAWRHRNGEVDVRYLQRIRSLLAKAESTEFEEEAESLTAKAQELMTRHSIDAALLSAHAAGRRAGELPTGMRVGVDDPYAQAKAFLLAEIGNASRCRTVWSRDFGFATVLGFESDLTSVEVLYTSLLLQARRAMMRTGDMGKKARSRSFRQSFLVGFAARIGQRLAEAAETALSDVGNEQGNGFLPVLAERSRLVDDLRNEAFGNLQQCSLSANDNAGWAIGAAAADVAEISRGPLIEERATA